MSDKDFKVKNKLIVSGLNNSSGVILATNNNLDSHNLLPTQYGGTGTTQSPTSGQILYSASGTTYSPTDISSLGLGGFSNVSVSSNITLQKSTNYFVNTSVARTLTLPASPSIGDEVDIFDASGSAATYNITVASNSLKINGAVQDLNINVNYAKAVLTYTGSAYGWKVE